MASRSAAEIAVDEDRRRDEVGLEAALAALEIMLFWPDEFVVLVLDLDDLARLRALPSSHRRR